MKVFVHWAIIVAEAIDFNRTLPVLHLVLDFQMETHLFA